MSRFKLLNALENVFAVVATISLIKGVINVLICLKDVNLQTDTPTEPSRKHITLYVRFVRKCTNKYNHEVYQSYCDESNKYMCHQCNGWPRNEMRLGVWNECILRDHNSILGITLDSRRARYVIMAEIFPGVINDLILDYFMPGDVMPSYPTLGHEYDGSPIGLGL